MSHLIPAADVERLASLTGLHDLEEFGRQLDGAENRAADLLAGDVQTAWEACLPFWIEQGRVRDLSRRVRVPKYWPSFANQLGSAFVSKFPAETAFMLQVFSTEPAESIEALCAYELLELMVQSLAADGLAVPHELLTSELPMPPVIRRELAHCAGDLPTIGAGLRLQRDGKLD
jgi:hypothetical protein